MIHVPPPDYADDMDALDAMLCAALDGAAADPVRLALVARLYMLFADLDRVDDLDRLHLEGPTPVYAMAR